MDEAVGTGVEVVKPAEQSPASTVESVSVSVSSVTSPTPKAVPYDYSSAPGKDIPEKDGMIYAHNAIRGDLSRIEQALAAIDVAQKWHTDNLAAWVKEFVVRVHHHHDIEEQIFLPWLKTKVEPPAKIASDHVTLVRQMTEFEAAVNALRDGLNIDAKTASLKSARDIFAIFNPNMREHLLEEEATLPHLMRLNFTLEEYHAMEQRIVKASTLTDLSWMAPWAFGVDPDGERHICAKLPGFLVFTYRKKWKPAYARYNALIESIYNSTVIPPHMQSAVSACWCF